MFSVNCLQCRSCPLASRQGRAGRWLPLPGWDSHFLPALTLALPHGRGDPHLSFPPCCSSLGKFISMANFPCHLQKERCKSSRAPCPRMSWGRGSRTPGDPAGLSLSPCLQLCPAPRQRSPQPSLRQIFCCLHLYFLCLPRAPNHSANSVCGERSWRVISRRISPLYSRLINSG